MLIIDSGGYELVPDFDLTEPKAPPYSPREGFDLSAYRQVLSELPSTSSIMIANFDFGMRGNLIPEQIEAAVDLFDDYPAFLHNFVVKPTKKAKYLHVAEIIAEMPKMRRFHALGVTEKELGGNLHDRMKVIAQLRLALDRADLSIPIHVWGGLDPITTPLYFVSGAEIFDGVSWLRYGYVDSVAIPRESYHAIASGVQTQWRRAEAMRLANNLGHLESATTSMRRFQSDERQDFSVFGRYAAEIESAFYALKTAVPDWKGVA